MNQPDDSLSENQRGKKFVPLEAITRVEKENGRWVVYLNVQSWEPDQDDPVANDWKRINDYSSEADAKVAASWYQRSANRTIRPPLGF
jgi:hypothetical protein